VELAAGSEGCGVKRPRRAPILTLKALEDWFQTVEPPGHCGCVSMLNGFLSGLAAGPVFMAPNDWMWHVIGDHEKRAFIGNKTQAVIDTVVDHYNLIASSPIPGNTRPCSCAPMRATSCPANGPTAFMARSS
jgi:uncharacterized protein